MRINILEAVQALVRDIKKWNEKKEAWRMAMEELANKGVPTEVINVARDEFDANFYFFGNKVETYQMFLVLLISSAILFGIYMLMLYRRSKKSTKGNNK